MAGVEGRGGKDTRDGVKKNMGSFCEASLLFLQLENHHWFADMIVK